MFICENHIIESNIKKLMRLQNIHSTCAFCGSDNICLDTESLEVHNLLKAIVRYIFMMRLIIILILVVIILRVLF